MRAGYTPPKPLALPAPGNETQMPASGTAAPVQADAAIRAWESRNHPGGGFPDAPTQQEMLAEAIGKWQPKPGLGAPPQNIPLYKVLTGDASLAPPDLSPAAQRAAAAQARGRKLEELLQGKKHK